MDVHRVVRELAGSRPVDQRVEHVDTIRAGLDGRLEIRTGGATGAEPGS